MMVLNALGVRAQNMCIIEERKICSSGGSLWQWGIEMCEFGLDLVGGTMNSLLEQNSH